MSRRTQITLAERQYELLRFESFRSSLSMAELIRRAVDQTYDRGRRPTIRGYEIGISVWRQPDIAVVGRIEPKRGRPSLE